MVGNLSDDGRLAHTGACSHGHQLTLTSTVSDLVEAFPWVGYRRDHLVGGDLSPEILTGQDTIRAVGLGIPHGRNDGLRLALLEALIGILEGQRGDLCLAGFEELHTLGGSFLSGFIHVEHKDDFFELVEVLQIFGNGFFCTTGTVRYRDHWPLVTLDLTDCETVDLPLGDNDLLARVPEL